MLMIKLFLKNLKEITWGCTKVGVALVLFMCFTLIELEWLLNYFSLAVASIISFMTSFIIGVIVVAWNLAKNDMLFHTRNEK